MPDQLDYFRDYLEAATDSSLRSRRILVLLLATSILVFIAFWNSRDSGWILTHVQWAKEIENVLTKASASTNPLSIDEKLIKARADVYQIENIKEAQHFHQKLLDLRAENVLYIRIPILGVAFDINDLGVFGGLAMAILLLWLRFSLWNERHNLQLCMEEANPGDMKAVYRYLSMRQLLTIPPSLGDTEKLERVWRWLARGLFSLPALAYGLVVGYDLLYSASLPPTGGLTVDLWVEGFGLLIVAGLSALAIHLLGDIDSLWEEFAEKARQRLTD